MKNIDLEIERILKSDIYIPSSYKEMIRNNIYMCEDKKIKSSNRILKLIPILCTFVFVISGMIFAVSNHEKIEHFFNYNKGIDTAIENGYILENKDEFVISNGIGIKVDNVVMDDYTLNLSFQLKFNDEVVTKEINRIELVDLLISDNDNKILCCEDKDIFDKFCKDKSLNYSWKQTNENYINSGGNYYIKSVNENQVNLIYNLNANNFPKSKSLNLIVNTIKIIGYDYNENIINGNWDIHIDLPEDFYNRENYYYEVVSCTNDKFNIDEVVVTNTNTKIQITTEEPPELPYNLDDDEETKMRKFIEQYEKDKNMTVEDYKKLMENRKFKNEYVENEKGEKFYPSNSTSEDCGYANKDMKYLVYWQTFDMNKYNATDEIKISLNYKGDDVEIILKKIK